MLKNIIYIIFTLLIWLCPAIIYAQPNGPGGPPGNGPGIQTVAVPYVTAKIVQPIQINRLSDLEFGDIAAGTSSNGTVIIDPNGNRTSTGGVVLMTVTTNYNAASFTVNGYPNAAFSIVLPSSIDIYSNSYSMLINNFTSNIGATVSVLNALGQANINVGATLNVDNNQSPGLYSGSFDVTVAYY